MAKKQSSKAAGRERHARPDLPALAPDQVPAFSDIRVKGKDMRRELRDDLRRRFEVPATWAEVKPYLVDGGVTGHKVGDILAILAVLRENEEIRAELAKYPMRDWEIGMQIKTALRERFVLNRGWKIAEVKYLNKQVTE